MITNFFNLNRKQYLIVLSVIWIIIQIIMFSIFGFKYDFEGMKYQEDAQQILNSFSFNPDRMFFSAYSLLIALFLKLKIGLKGVILLQLIYSYITVNLLFKLSEKLLGKPIFAFYTALVFILSPQLQMWNMHLYTESIFINSLVVFSYFVFSFKGRKADYIKIIFMLIILSFQRPIGIAASLPAIIYFLLQRKYYQINTLKIVSFLGLILIAHSALILLNLHNFDEFIFATKGQFSLIGGYNALPMPSKNQNIPLVFLKAMIYKAFFLFSMWRPYFSGLHNFAQVIFSIIYIPAIFGLYTMFNENKSAFYYFFLFAGGYSFLFVITYVNYHCRYVSSILPFIIIISGFGVKSMINFYFNLRNKNL